MSKQYSLGGADYQKLGLGLIIAMVGAGLTYLESTIPGVDFGPTWTPIVVAINSVLVNVIRKFFTESI